jgi:DNA-binding XRE family transcriptional regulator
MTTKKTNKAKKLAEKEFYSSEEVYREAGIQLPLTFGDLIRTWRKCDGLTQSQLAEKLGISTQLLSAYERGIQLPTLKTGIKLAQDVGLFLPQAIQALLEAQLQQACITNYTIKVIPNVS